MTQKHDLETVIDDIGPVETIAQAIALFETVGMPARNLSALTRRSYANDLGHLHRFLESRGITELAGLNLKHLEAYQAEMDRRGYSSATRNRKTQAIRVFFQFLHRQEVLADNVAARLIPPPIQKREPRFLSEEEYQRLLRACSHHARDAAAIEILLQTGMRLSELARLTLTDIELPKRFTPDPENTGTAHVRRKGGKQDTVPLNFKACRAIAAYLKVRPKVGHDTIFVSKFKTPMTPRAIEYMLSKYLAEAGIKNASVHTLRHTMATHHVAKGTDLKTVQETLGHVSLETTTIYVSLAKKAQRKALQEHAL